MVVKAGNNHRQKWVSNPVLSASEVKIKQYPLPSVLGTIERVISYYKANIIIAILKLQINSDWFGLIPIYGGSLKIHQVSTVKVVDDGSILMISRNSSQFYESIRELWGYYDSSISIFGRIEICNPDQLESDVYQISNWPEIPDKTGREQSFSQMFQGYFNAVYGDKAIEEQHSLITNCTFSMIPVISSDKTEREQGSLMADCTNSQFTVPPQGKTDG